MKGKFFSINAAAGLFLAMMYYMLESSEALALGLAAAVHELGHIICLRLLGMKIRGIRAELKGFCISYSGYTGAVGHALAAAAGPGAGLAYALFASRLGSRLNLDWLCLSAGISLLLSLFNLLPALPLDGGRILAQLSQAFLGERRGAALSEAIGLGTALVFLAFGLWIMYKGRGAGAAIAGVWILIYQESALGIVKRQEML